MIEIIEKGPEKFVTTCQGCGTKFSYELDDIWNSSFSPSPYVLCPVCNDRCYHSIHNTDKNSTAINTSGYVVLDDTVSTSISKEELEDKYKELKDKVHRDKVSGSISLPESITTNDLVNRQFGIQIDSEDPTHITEVHLNDISTTQLRDILDRLEQYCRSTEAGKLE